MATTSNISILVFSFCTILVNTRMQTLHQRNKMLKWNGCMVSEAIHPVHSVSQLYWSVFRLNWIILAFRSWLAVLKHLPGINKLIYLLYQSPICRVSTTLFTLVSYSHFLASLAAKINIVDTFHKQIWKMLMILFQAVFLSKLLRIQ